MRDPEREKGYAIVILKPDSVRDGLEANMIQDLRRAEIEVLWGKYWQVPSEAVSLIYPKEVGKSTYSSTKRALTFGPSLILLVRGTDIYNHLTVVKGKMDKGGIRGRYCEKSKEELIEMGYSGKRLQDRLAENRLHSADDLQETIIVCSLCMTSFDKRQIREIAPDFYETCSELSQSLAPNGEDMKGAVCPLLSPF